MTRKTTATERTKTMLCRDCNEPMEVGANQRYRPRCIPCGEAAAVTAIREMKEKSGPNYDRWRAGMAAALRRL